LPLVENGADPLPRFRAESEDALPLPAHAPKKPFRGRLIRYARTAELLLKRFRTEDRTPPTAMEFPDY